MKDQTLKMKAALIFVTFFSITLANDLFIGEWKEDPYKREIQIIFYTQEV